MFELTRGQSIIFYSIIIILSSILLNAKNILVKYKFDKYEEKIKEKIKEKNFYFLKKNIEKISYSISFFIIWIPVAFRYNVGTDYPGYINGYYETYNLGKVFYRPEGYLSIMPEEFGYNLLTDIIRLIGRNPQYIFIIMSFITILVIYLLLYKLRNKVDAGVFLFAFNCLMYAQIYNISRQYIAISIIMYSYIYILKDEKLKVIGLLIIASLFHRTALLVIPIYYLVLINKKITILRVGSCLSIAILVVFNYENIVSIISEIPALSKYAYYAQETTNNSNMISMIIKRLPFALLIYYNYEKIIKNNPRNIRIITMIFFEFMLSLLGVVNVWASRLALYFYPAYAIIVAIIFKFSNEYRDRIYKAVIIGYLYIYFIYVYVYIGDSGIIPYRGIFDFNIL